MARKHLILLFALIASPICTAEVRADFIAALEYSGGSVASFIDTTHTVGYTFVVHQPVVVTALSWAIPSGQAVDAAHPVQIWNLSQTVLASATLGDGGPAEARTGHWVYETIAPVTLAAGTYIIGGLEVSDPNGGDLWHTQFATVTSFDSAYITYGESRHNLATSGSLRFPDFRGGLSGSFFGPGFQVTVAPVPEPSSLALPGVVGFGLAQSLWRRRKRAA